MPMTSNVTNGNLEQSFRQFLEFLIRFSLSLMSAELFDDLIVFFVA